MISQVHFHILPIQNKVVFRIWLLNLLACITGLGINVLGVVPSWLYYSQNGTTPDTKHPNPNHRLMQWYFASLPYNELQRSAQLLNAIYTFLTPNTDGTITLNSTTLVSRDYIHVLSTKKWHLHVRVSLYQWLWVNYFYSMNSKIQCTMILTHVSPTLFCCRLNCSNLSSLLYSISCHSIPLETYIDVQWILRHWVPRFLPSRSQI